MAARKKTKKRIGGQTTSNYPPDLKFGNDPNTGKPVTSGPDPRKIHDRPLPPTYSTNKGNPGTRGTAGKPTTPKRPPGKPPAKGPAAPRVPTGGVTKGAGNAVAAALTLGSGGNELKDALLALLAQASGLKPPSPTFNENFLSKYLSNFDPIAKSETEASLAYDDTIGGLQSQLDRIDSGLPGIMSDLDKWYGMLGAANREAAASNQAALAARTDELGDATQAFIAAAGGAASQGTPSVAAEGVISQGALQAMGQAQSNFDNNIGQFFQQALASQKAGIYRDAMRDRSELARQMSQATKERGLYKSKAQSGYDADRMQLALQLRNDLYDQRTNRYDAQMNSILSRANLLGMASTAETDADAADIRNAQGVEEWKRAVILNEQERLRLQQFQDSMGGEGETYPFNQLTPGARASLAGQLMTNLLGPKGYLTVNPNQFLKILSNRLYNVAGYQRTPQTEAFLQSLLEPRLINWWNKYHPNQKYTG